MCRCGVHGARYEAVVRMTRNQAQGRKEIAQMKESSRLIHCSAGNQECPQLSLVRQRHMV